VQHNITTVTGLVSEPLSNRVLWSTDCVGYRLVFVSRIIIYSFLKDVIAPGQQVNAINTGLLKALNKTDYDLLISRLDNIGVRNYLLFWLFSNVDLRLNKKKTIVLFLEVFFCYSSFFPIFIYSIY